MSHRLSLVVLLLAMPAIAAEPAPVGVVSHVKVVSDKVEDVSSLEAWKKSFLKEGMSDEKKALAIWETVVKFRHQDPPPQELFNTGCVHDPIKTFNVYGYGMCCCASCNIAALSRAAGLQARGWGINGHSVPEVSWDGKSWHMLDASLMTYFPKADGQIAGVEEMVAGVQGWYEKNPGLRKDNDKLAKFMSNGGWKKGPARPEPAAPPTTTTAGCRRHPWLVLDDAGVRLQAVPLRIRLFAGLSGQRAASARANG